jgi:DNA polymerase III subunit delta'
MNLREWEQATVANLIDAEQVGRQHHAYLICDSSSDALMRIAKAFAKVLVCDQHAASKIACNSCVSCRWFEMQQHPDIHQLLLDPDKASIGIDAVREWSANLQLTPQRAMQQIAILHPADKLTLAAANALLKNLEEPAPNTIILLTCETAAKLLPTIRSRCIIARMQQPQKEVATAWLIREYGVNATQAKSSLDLALGRPDQAAIFLHDDTISKMREVVRGLLSVRHSESNQTGVEQMLAREPLAATVMARFCMDLAKYAQTNYWAEWLDGIAFPDRCGAAISLQHLAGQARKIGNWSGSGVNLSLAWLEWIASFKLALNQG